MLIQKNLLIFEPNGEGRIAVWRDLGSTCIGVGPHPIQLIPSVAPTQQDLFAQMGSTQPTPAPFSLIFLNLSNFTVAASSHLITQIFLQQANVKIVALASPLVSKEMETLDDCLILPPEIAPTEAWKLLKSQALAFWALEAQKELLQHQAELKQNLSHALKTPTQVIQGLSQTILDLPLSSAEQRQALEEIHRASLLLGEVMEELSFSRLLDQGGTPSGKYPLELTSFLAQLAAHFTKETGQTQVNLELPSHPVQINAHAGMITQALVNLLVYSTLLKPASPLHLTLTEEFGQVWIRLHLSHPQNPVSPDQESPLQEARRYIQALGSCLVLQEERKHHHFSFGFALLAD